MNIFSFINKNDLPFSFLNIMLFIILLLFPIPIIRSIKGILLVLIALFYLILLLQKCFFLTSNTPLFDKECLYQQNSELMNKVLAFKNHELNGLQTEISIKDKIYKQLFDFAPDAFIIYNESNVLYFNDAFTDLLSIKDGKSISSKELWKYVHPKFISKVKIAYDELLSKSTDIVTQTLEILTSDNTIKEVKISSSITFFQDIPYIFSCLHDLSSHNEQERIKVELENNIANEKFKVEFFANISHDIKTPINVIYSAVQLQEMYTESKDYDKVIVYNSIIKQNCLRLQKLLNDVLDITKIDANHFKPNLELCNIICSIEYITESITSYLEHKDITIIFDTNVETKFVMADLNFIERIMLNLISNAIKYGKQNGHVWVTLHDEGSHLIICVKDDGIGIPKEHISKIFTRFHKTNQNLANETSSNGIGLSLVKSMVKTLGGDISCLSTLEVGSEFIITLPMESLEGDEGHCCEYAASLELNNKLNIELSDI